MLFLCVMLGLLGVLALCAILLHVVLFVVSFRGRKPVAKRPKTMREDACGATAATQAGAHGRRAKRKGGMDETSCTTFGPELKKVRWLLRASCGDIAFALFTLPILPIMLAHSFLRSLDGPAPPFATSSGATATYLCFYTPAHSDGNCHSTQGPSSEG